MGQNHRFDDRDIERLLSGKAPNDPSCQNLTEALLELRAAHRQAPSEETARAHVAAMVEEAKSLAATGELGTPATTALAVRTRIRKPLRKRLVRSRPGRVLVRLTAAAVGLSLISGGLVLAGVNIPGLPDQASDKAKEATAEAAARAEARGDAGVAQTPAFLETLLDYINDPGGDEGCVFGQTVAGIASNGKVSAEDPCARAAAAGSKATGEAASADGRARAEDAKSTGAEKSASGRARAEQGRATGEEKSSQGQQTAGDAQGSGQGGQGSGQGSQQTGEEKSGQGSSTAEDKSGGRSRGPQ